jgi:leucyl aminopeptidase
VKTKNKARPAPARRRSVALVFLGPGLTYLVVLMLVPLALVLGYTFFRRGRFGGVVYEFTLDNLARLADPLYLGVVGQSAVLAAVTTGLALLLGYPTAYMPSGSAQRPSDVITHYGGRTVEVLNTDAEGRLVLADALAYADAVLEPDVVVDIATLTGAIAVALGRHVGAVYTDDDALAKELTEAGQAGDDRLWRMPLIEDYGPALLSPVADLANVEAGSTYGAGSITAALFLREFTGGRPWAHLDIAGVGRSTVEEGTLSKGATGFGVRLLLEWLSRRA